MFGKCENMDGIIKCKLAMFEKLETCLGPLLLLAIRLYVAWIFFKSGWLKLESYLNGNWDLTIYLFTEEHPVPFLSPEIAAFLGTGGELLFPALLALGIAGRFGALGLLAMTAVIEFTYKALPVHDMWALLLAVILIYGPGRLSVDYYLKRWFLKESK